MSDAEYLMIAPGEDMSKEMNVLVKMGPGEENTVRLSYENLEPNTEYEYSEGGIDFSFKTSMDPLGDTYPFTFGWIADVHFDPSEPAKPENVDKLVSNMEREGKMPLSLILFSGDLVKFGNVHEMWMEWDKVKAFNHYPVAFLPGNKEYYKLLDNQGKHIKAYSGEWYRENSINTDNGPEGVEGTYYFIANRTMFISINSCQEKTEDTVDNELSSDEITSLQQTWFEDVLKSNAGKYDYIVTQTHFAYFANEKPGGAPCSWGLYEKWRKLYDKWGVDFALSGDYHEYLRTHRLFDNHRTRSEDKGTCYITFPQVSDRIWDMNLKEYENSLVAISSIGTTIAGGLFEVDEEGICFKLLYVDGKVADSIIMKKKER